jgi:hypothetical protein
MARTRTRRVSLSERIWHWWLRAAWREVLATLRDGGVRVWAWVRGPLA